MTDAERDRTYARARLGGPLPRGARPAVVVVDFSLGFTDQRMPLGADLTSPVIATKRLLDLARARALPIFFTTVSFAADGSDLGLWRWKSPTMAALVPGSPGVRIDDRLKVRPGEPVLTKQGASAFFGTGLAERLRTIGVDTLLVCGATTSGCVRATAVDALQHGIPALVVRECVGDRAQGPHDSALFDIQAKYADVVALDEAIRYVESRGGSVPAS